MTRRNLTTVPAHFPMKVMNAFLLAAAREADLKTRGSFYPLSSETMGAKMAVFKGEYCMFAEVLQELIQF